jgi:hypothetical protein
MLGHLVSNHHDIPPAHTRAPRGWLRRLLDFLFRR